MMDDLIEALQILRKYGNPEFPTHCEHDMLCVMTIMPSTVSPEDITRLGALGFDIADESTGEAYFYSLRFGSA